jgi:P27 family predicted phage terminase small subunit
MMDLRTIEGGDGLPPEPEWSLHYSDELDVAAAGEEWRTICSYMRDADTLAVANGHSIRRLVEFRVQWRRASEHVAEHGAIIKAKTTGKGGQWNPNWSVMRQADQAIRALEAELGLSPRRRAAAVKARRRRIRRIAADDYLDPPKRG